MTRSTPPYIPLALLLWARFARHPIVIQATVIPCNYVVLRVPKRRTISNHKNKPMSINVMEYCLSRKKAEIVDV